MADPIRAAAERLVARLDETTDPNGPVPAWSDSFLAARTELAQPEPAGEVSDNPPVPISAHDLAIQWNQQADPSEQWDTLEPYEQLAWAQSRAIALALSRRAPVQPADGDVAELVDELGWIVAQLADIGWHDNSASVARAAALLQHPQPPQPVAVSERLPGAKDCDAEGRCWLLTVEDEYPQWRFHSIEGNQPGGATMIWVPVDSSPGVMVDCFYTSHWLPAHALPHPTPPEMES